jgi:hypothetical protein
MHQRAEKPCALGGWYKATNAVSSSPPGYRCGPNRWATRTARQLCTGVGHHHVGLPGVGHTGVGTAWNSAPPSKRTKVYRPITVLVFNPVRIQQSTSFERLRRPPKLEAERTRVLAVLCTGSNHQNQAR